MFVIFVIKWHSTALNNCFCSLTFVPYTLKCDLHQRIILSDILLLLIILENHPLIWAEVEVVNSHTAAKNRLRWKSLLSHRFQVPRRGMNERLKSGRMENKRVTVDVGAMYLWLSQLLVTNVKSHSHWTQRFVCEHKHTPCYISWSTGTY